MISICITKIVEKRSLLADTQSVSAGKHQENIPLLKQKGVISRRGFRCSTTDKYRSRPRTHDPAVDLDQVLDSGNFSREFNLLNIL